MRASMVSARRRHRPRPPPPPRACAAAPTAGRRIVPVVESAFTVNGDVSTFDQAIPCQPRNLPRR